MRIFESNEGKRNEAKSERGYTVLELIVTLGFVAVLAGSATFQARSLSDPIQNQTALVLSFVKQIRARAVSTTASYLIYPASATQISVAKGTACPATIPPTASTLVGASFTADNPKIVLGEKVQLATQTWGVCVTQRGLFTGASNIQLVDTEGKSRTINIFLGGATRVQ